MLTFTDKAREMVLTFMDQGGEDHRDLRIHVTGGSPAAPSFELTIAGNSDRGEDDVEVDAGGFMVVFDPGSADKLEGATVDFVNRVNGSGFEVIPATASLPTPSLGSVPKGALAEKVQLILDEQVNPSIASHGGQINLVDVKGTEVFMEMTGGCQGCAASQMTLRQGVENMIQQHVPEVTEIHDVTDHDAGENPYFSD
jgi:Fe/S biogenesis protein NfuA